MSNLCQDCFALVRPTEYFPETFRDGTCDACGQDAFVARVTKAEVELAKQPTETPLERMQREERSGLAGYHVTSTANTETRESWLARRQQEDFEQAMRGPNAPDELGD